MAASTITRPAGPRSTRPSGAVVRLRPRPAGPHIGPTDPGLPLAVGFGAVPLPAPLAIPSVEPRPPLRLCAPVEDDTAVPASAGCADAVPASALRLTARGRLMAWVLVGLAVAGVVLAAWAGARPDSGPVGAPATVTVRAGDTLWDIAARVAPGRDTRQEVADLQRLNGLDGSALQPGRTLRTR